MWFTKCLATGMEQTKTIKIAQELERIGERNIVGM